MELEQLLDLPPDYVAKRAEEIRKYVVPNEAAPITTRIGGRNHPHAEKRRERTARRLGGIQHQVANAPPLLAASPSTPTHSGRARFYARSGELSEKDKITTDEQTSFQRCGQDAELSER